MPDPARYRVTLRDLHAHLYEVEAEFPSDGSRIDLWLPTWTPGSYLVREFARHVQDVAARDAQGDPVRIERRDKNSWRVTPGDAPSFRVTYRVYANELSVRTSHLDGTHGFFNGTNLFITADDFRSRPCEVTVNAPEGWGVFCALDNREGTFLAASYDELVDSPFEVGPHPVTTFRASGVEHRLVIWGAGNYDAALVAQDLAKLCEAEIALFGGSPCRRYLFILLTADRGRGGLEHASSSALLYPRFGFRPKKNYEDFLSLAAHEYFHLWNVKRIKPRAFVPYAYDRENYTTLLWAMEGITSYYDTLMLRRAGLISAQRYLEKVGELFTILARNPGRRTLSLADASLLTWVKFYRPDENAPNNQVSYYAKGEAVALLLDLLIRRKTNGARSLDHLMRLLWSRYGNGQGMPEDAAEAAASELAGESLAPFFDRAIRSTEELDPSALAAAGLLLKTRQSFGPNDKGGAARSEDESGRKLWLGITTKPVEGRVVIASVLAGSPAAEAGLYADDEIVAANGYRTEAASWMGRLHDDAKPGDCITFSIFRRDQLLEVPVTVRAAPEDTCYLEADPSANEEAMRVFESWLGEAFPRK